MDRLSRSTVPTLRIVLNVLNRSRGFSSVLMQLGNALARFVILCLAAFIGHTTFYINRDLVSEPRKWLTAILVFSLVGLATS
jgi:hypothetical protein